MHKTKRLLLLASFTLKALITPFVMQGAQAASSDTNDIATSPLLASTQAGKNNAKLLANMLQNTSQGPLNAQNLTPAMQEVMQSNPGHNSTLWAAAINQLNLPSHILRSAIFAASSQLQTPAPNFTAQLINHTLSTQGITSAKQQATKLRQLMPSIFEDETNPEANEDILEKNEEATSRLKFAKEEDSLYNG